MSTLVLDVLATGVASSSTRKKKKKTGCAIVQHYVLCLMIILFPIALFIHNSEYNSNVSFVLYF